MAAVEDGDDRQAEQVVDDREGQQVGAHPVGQPAAARQGQRAQRERGVGGHRGAPAVRGRPPGVEGEVDRDRDDHAAEPGQERQRHPAAHPQLAHVPLAARLEADHQEEQRHQPGVDELPQAHRHPVAVRARGQRHRPEPVVAARPRRCTRSARPAWRRARIVADPVSVRRKFRSGVRPLDVQAVVVWSWRLGRGLALVAWAAGRPLLAGRDLAGRCLVLRGLRRACLSGSGLLGLGHASIVPQGRQSPGRARADPGRSAVSWPGGGPSPAGPRRRTRCSG